jgi:putative PIN family toxin of toxin-antitoxin system
MLIAQQRLVPLVSTAVFLEYEEVLRRAEQRLATGMSETDVDGSLAAFASAAEAVDIHFRWRPQMADTDDEMILESAVNGKADALITHNIADFRAAARGFGLPVMTPAELFKELKK